MVSTLMPEKKMIAMNVDIDEIFENIDGSLEEGGFWDGLEFGPIPGDPFVELPHVDSDKTFLLYPFDDGISTSQSPSPNSVLQCQLPKICKTRKRRRTKRRQRRSPWPGIPQPIGCTSKKTKQKKKKKLFNLSNVSSDNKEIRDLLQPAKKCTHCEITETPQWRAGPMGPKTLCNACGVRYRSGRLFPEYRPAASPTFIPCLHSNSHRKVLEMRNKRGTEAMADDVDCHATSAPLEYDHATSVPLGYDCATSAPPEFVPMNGNLLDDI